MDDPSILAFGDLLRRARHAAGLTQEELAERANMSVRGISDLERGIHRVPRKETLQWLADALGVDERERAAWEGARRRNSTLATTTHRASTATERAEVIWLPRQATAIVGREQEITELRAMLRNPETRLVTITGPGGIGKTRLAIAVAASLADDFPDGVYFVDLAPLPDPDDFLSAVARALGVRSGTGSAPAEAVSSWIGSKGLLLVADNFEHLIDAAPVVMMLLARCPRLRILLTSRVRLRLRDEQEYLVPPLSVPDPAIALDARTLEAYAATALFLQTARLVNRNFHVTATGASRIGAICRRLDGLPLAIELAAARVKLLSPDAILARLSQPLAVLAGGARDSPARQRTLRDTIDWSYTLLEPVEQQLFRRLAVFASGWTVEAAESVVNRDDDLDGNLLDHLSALVDSNLVRQIESPGDAPRLAMAETIREYGLERLAGHGEEARIRAHHARYFVEHAMAMGDPGNAWGGVDWHRVGGAEYDNLRAALRWTIDAGQSDLAHRLAAILGRYWIFHGDYNEGRRWLERVRRLPAGSDLLNQRATILLCAGTLARYLGDYNDAYDTYNAKLRLGLSGDTPDYLECRAGAYTQLGHLKRREGRYDEAEAYYRQGLQIRQQLNDALGITISTGSLAYNARVMGDLVAARALFMTFLQRSLEARFQRGIAQSWIQLAVIDIEEERYDQAQVHLSEGLSVAESAHLTPFIGEAQQIGAVLALRLGDDAQAASLLHQALSTYQSLNTQDDIVIALVTYVELCVARGRNEAAVRLAAVARRHSEDTSLVLPVPQQRTLDAALARARTTLGEERYATLWHSGRGLTLGDACADALRMNLIA